MHVFSNLAISLDGKISAQDRSLFYLGSPNDRRQMQVLRKKSDAILIGASTLRSLKRPMKIRNSKRQPMNVILSSRLDGLSPKWPFFKDPELTRILFVGSECPEKKIKEFSKTCTVIKINFGKDTPRTIVAKLGKMKIKNLLIEGGGGIMWEFVEAKLIDEFHVTLTPWILGGTEAPTLVDGKGFPAHLAQRLVLKKVRRIGEELFLTYLRK